MSNGKQYSSPEFGQERIIKYDLLRSILIVLVVLGHATGYLSVSFFGGFDYETVMLNHGVTDSTFHVVLSYLTGWIYSFHMPIIIALSGTLYGLKRERGGTLFEYSVKKFKRLIIPFLIVWLLWNVPIKLFIGYYNPISIKNILLQMIFPGRVHLWFLESLFLISVIMYCIDRNLSNEKIKSVIIVILWILGYIIIRKTGILHPFGDPLYYLAYYYFGIHLERIVCWLKKRNYISKTINVVLLFCHFGLYSIFSTIKVKGLGAFVSVCILPFLMGIVLYSFMDEYYVRRKELVHFLSEYGLGIYLYSEPLNYLALYLYVSVFGVTVLGDNLGSILLWVIRVLITPLISVGIVKILKKLKIQYLY